MPHCLDYSATTASSNEIDIDIDHDHHDGRKEDAGDAHRISDSCH